MRQLTPLEKRAKTLRSAVDSLGKSTKPSLSERAGIVATMKGAPTIRGEDGKTPVRGVDYFTKEDIDTLKKEMLDPSHIKEVIAQMQKLPEAHRLDVSGIRNFQSFIYGGNKYGVHELMHGGAAAGTTAITFIYNEVVTGSGTAFTLGATPTVGTVTLYGNGQFLTPGGVDYTIVGAAITTINSFSAGAIIANYQS